MGKHTVGGKLKSAAAPVAKQNLRFKSFANGRLDANGKEVVQKVIEGENVAVLETTPVSVKPAVIKPAPNSKTVPRVHKPREPTVYFSTLDKSKKDIVIFANSILRNKLKTTTTYPFGKQSVIVTESAFLADYDFAKDLTSMSAEQKINLFKREYFEIEVQLKTFEEEKLENFGAESVDRKSVVDQLGALGFDFSDNVINITVTIYLPKDVKAATIPPVQVWSGKGFDRQILNVHGRAPFTFSSPNFKALEEITNYLNKCTKISSATILLHYQGLTLSMPELYYSVAFYGLKFTDWNIKYLPPSSFDVPATIKAEWILKSIDREYARLITQEELTACKKAKEEAARQERMLGAVRVGSGPVINMRG